MNTIKKDTTYTIDVNGIERSGMKKSDVWNGLVCYEHHEGSVIAFNGESCIFSFLEIEEIKKEELNVIAVSGCFNVKNEVNARG